MKKASKKAAAGTKSPIKKKPNQLFHEFTDDLVNVKEYAKRMGVSHTAVIYWRDNGGLLEEDIYWICGRRYWSWEKYKGVEFREYHRDITN